MSTSDAAGRRTAVACCLLAVGASCAVGGEPRPEPVRIGLVAPARPQGDALVRGAESAAAEVNAAGGIGGRPLRLVHVESARPWRDGAMLLARTTFENDLLALVGASDGETAHVAAQIATKKRIPVLTLAAEQTVTGTKDPWVFSGIPADGEQALALLGRAFGEPRGKTAVLVVPRGRSGRRRADAVRAACAKAGVRLVETLHEDAGSGDNGGPVAGADALLLWSDPGPAVDFLRRFGDDAGWRWILGSSRLNVPEFTDLARTTPATLAVVALREEAVAHDLVRILAGAARRDGADSAALRDALLAGNPDAEGSAAIEFDASGRRAGVIPVSVVRPAAARATRRYSSDRGRP